MGKARSSPKPLVLLVEDDAWLAGSYQATIEPICRCRIVSSAQAAMDAIDEERPSVVIVDMLIEHGTAIDLLHEMQSHSDTSPLPIIVCSGIGSTLSLGDLRSYGVIAVRDKATLTPVMLRQEVEAALHHGAVV